MPKKILLLLCLLVTANLGFAQNPFSAGSNKQTPVREQTVMEITVFDSSLQKIVQWQREIRKFMAQFILEIKREGIGPAFLTLLGFSFLYGLVHALGPGHGKAITVSYFLSGDKKIGEGLLFGNAVMFIHTLSGVTITLIIWFFLENARFAFLDDSVGITQNISFVLILLIGLYLLLHNYREYKHLKHHSPHHSLKSENRRNLLITALAIGFVPCPGTSAIIIFSLSNQLLMAGLFAIVFVALGMGFTISFFAVLTVLAQQRMLKFVSHNPKLYRTIYLVLSQSGAMAIILIAILMLV